MKSNKMKQSNTTFQILYALAYLCAALTEFLSKNKKEKGNRLSRLVSIFSTFYTWLA
jgi:hypothetical protein